MSFTLFLEKELEEGLQRRKEALTQATRISIETVVQ